MDTSGFLKRGRPGTPPGIHSVTGASSDSPSDVTRRHSPKLDYDLGQVSTKLQAAMQTQDLKMVLQATFEATMDKLNIRDAGRWTGEEGA